jgi:hypothetical protein
MKIHGGSIFCDAPSVNELPKNFLVQPAAVGNMVGL